MIKIKAAKVAPLVGAWIEIFYALMTKCKEIVAPLVGAWIEIVKYLSSCHLRTVAPLVGAWIEIRDIRPDRPSGKSRSPCGSVD